MGIFLFNCKISGKNQRAVSSSCSAQCLPSCWTLTWPLGALMLDGGKKRNIPRDWSGYIGQRTCRPQAIICMLVQLALLPSESVLGLHVSSVVSTLLITTLIVLQRYSRCKHTYGVFGDSLQRAINLSRWIAAGVGSARLPWSWCIPQGDGKKWK